MNQGAPVGEPFPLQNAIWSATPKPFPKEDAKSRWDMQPALHGRRVCVPSGIKSISLILLSSPNFSGFLQLSKYVEFIPISFENLSGKFAFIPDFSLFVKCRYLRRQPRVILESCDSRVCCPREVAPPGVRELKL